MHCRSYKTLSLGHLKVSKLRPNNNDAGSHAVKLKVQTTSTELPTSTFLPYFVRFLKENTAVRFFLQKYVFLKSDFFFFFFFFILESESYEIYTHYLCYKNLVRVFE